VAVTVVFTNGFAGEGSIELSGSRGARVVEVSALTVEVSAAPANGVVRDDEMTEPIVSIKQTRQRMNATE
jgi:hypothetical protein